MYRLDLRLVRQLVREWSDETCRSRSSCIRPSCPDFRKSAALNIRGQGESRFTYDMTQRPPKIESPGLGPRAAETRARRADFALFRVTHTSSSTCTHHYTVTKTDRDLHNHDLNRFWTSTCSRAPPLDQRSLCGSRPTCFSSRAIPQSQRAARSNPVARPYSTSPLPTRAKPRSEAHQGRKGLDSGQTRLRH